MAERELRSALIKNFKSVLSSSNPDSHTPEKGDIDFRRLEKEEAQDVAFRMLQTYLFELNELVKSDPSLDKHLIGDFNAVLDVSAPGVPATKPGASAASKPGASAASKPGASAASKPGASSSKPGASSAAKPDASSASKSGVSTSKPGASTSKPGLSYTEPKATASNASNPITPGFFDKNWISYYEKQVDGLEQTLMHRRIIDFKGFWPKSYIEPQLFSSLSLEFCRLEKDIKRRDTLIENVCKNFKFQDFEELKELNIKLGDEIVEFRKKFSRVKFYMDRRRTPIHHKVAHLLMKLKSHSECFESNAKKEKERVLGAE